MSLLHVEHVTEYDYVNRVELAAHLVHLRPRTLPWQEVRRFTLRAEPVPDRVRWGTDHFGNPVAWLFLERAHASLLVATDAVVDVRARPVPAPDSTPGWEAVAEQALQPDAAREVAEFSFGSPRAPADPRPGNPIRAYAAQSFPPGRPVLAGDTITVGAEVDDVAVDPAGCGWVTVVGSVAVDGAIRSRVVIVPLQPDSTGLRPHPPRSQPDPLALSARRRRGFRSG